MKGVSDENLYTEEHLPHTQPPKSSVPTGSEMAELANSSGFTVDQIQEFYEAFRMFDRDGDGIVTKDELQSVLSSLGQTLSQHDLLNLMKEADKDGNDAIDFQEFVGMIAQKMKGRNWEDVLQGIFAMLDRDGDGHVSWFELKFIISHLGEDFSDEEIREMIHQVDSDGDGMLNIREFVKLMSV